MRKVAVAAALGSMLCFAASTSMAMGFGRVDNATVLGHPLDFTAGINIESDEWIAQECVAAEVLSGDNKLAPAQVRVRLSAPTANSRPTVHVTTTVGIDEPVVTVKLLLGCPPRLSREFVAFVDPPAVGLPQTPVAEAAAPVTAAAAPPSSSESAQTVAMPAPIASAPAPRVAPRAASRRTKRPAVVATTGPRAALTVPLAAPASGERTKPAVVARAPSPASGPRLMLEPAQALLKSPAPAASTPAPTAPLAVMSAADAVDAQARERQRLSGVEDRLERMLKESAATQRTVAALQARLRDAEAARRTSPLVYGLLALVGLLLIVIAALLWRQSRIKQESAWWRGAAKEAERAPTPSEPESTTRGPAADRTATQMRIVTPPVAAAATVVADKSAAEAAASLAEPVRRELSVEELIDLEQQAEFFIVLGQDEAAIDLLMSHVRSSGGASPMPYLKLLDIYRRRGDREAYARIRERFNRRFNAYAPEWDADPRDGRMLEGYPVVISRLQVAWPQPAKAMELLESLLFRRDSSDGTFDLPAYGELLFLYALARDLAEREPGPDAVDLLLPLNTAVDEVADADATVAMPILPLIHIDTDTPEVDVELDLDAAGPAPKP